MKQVDAQIDSLKRQARQASRYKSLASDIPPLRGARRAVDASRGRAGSGRFRAQARSRCPRSRRAHHAAGGSRAPAGARSPRPAFAARRRERAPAQPCSASCWRARRSNGRKARRERAAEIARRIVQIGRDLEREKALIEDANQSIARLEAEDGELAEINENESDLRAETAERASDEEKLAETEHKLAEAQSLLADASAPARFRQKRAFATRPASGAFRGGDHAARNRIRDDRVVGSGEDEAVALAEALENLLMEAQAPRNALAAEDAHAQARGRKAMRGPLTEADRRAQHLETEARTLSNFSIPDRRRPVAAGRRGMTVARVTKPRSARRSATISTRRPTSAPITGRRPTAAGMPRCRRASSPVEAGHRAAGTGAPPRADRRRAARGRPASARAAEARPAPRVARRRPLALGRVHPGRGSADATRATSRREEQAGDLMREANRRPRRGRGIARTRRTGRALTLRAAAQANRKRAPPIARPTRGGETRERHTAAESVALRPPPACPACRKPRPRRSPIATRPPASGAGRAASGRTRRTGLARRRARRRAAPCRAGSRCRRRSARRPARR